MEPCSGWTERPTSNDFAVIYDHAAGYIILGILEEDGIRRWDLAKGHGPESRIISEHPFCSLFDALEVANEMIARDDLAVVSSQRSELRQAG